MLSIKGEKREILGKKIKNLREQGVLPAVLYGPEIDNLSVQMDYKEFEKIYKEAGKSTLVSLEIENKKFLVLVHDIKKDPITGDLIHIDFYQPILTKEVEAQVPIVFEGESLAVKELGGTLVKEVQEIAVKALPQDLPHEIKVDIESLKTFEDEILIKDLNLPENVSVHKDPSDVVALVTPPQKVEEELEKPIEEEEKKEEEGEQEEKDESSSAKATADKEEKKDKKNKKDEE